MVRSVSNNLIEVPGTHTRVRRSGRAFALRFLRCHWLLEPLVLLAFLLVLVSGAIAADLPDPAPSEFDPILPQGAIWAGPYLGVEAGVSQTVTDIDSGGRKKDISRVDAAFGLFGGYNWEVSRFVLGVEGSATYLGAREKGRHPTLGSVDTGSKWSASLKARAGVPIQNVMPYLSLGIAATDHSLKANGKEHSSVNIGPVLGGGVEVAIRDSWRVRADYSLTGIVDTRDSYNGTRAKRTAGNHRLMIGLSRSF
ncbi:porin family protein [Roseibium denhamense]|uniref:Opacity protein n=1 Tax=Roseibium denhamense TaxID=76305 RepID=A0ABY1N610_9HYPH|nr:porin family protein [Roseibium denhamense]MTI06094.1 porin family protein [Roseibium denhamense]SMP01178.1 Opacity protein [Roseibium denhamense]